MFLITRTIAFVCFCYVCVAVFSLFFLRMFGDVRYLNWPNRKRWLPKACVCVRAFSLSPHGRLETSSSVFCNFLKHISRLFISRANSEGPCWFQDGTRSVLTKWYSCGFLTLTSFSRKTPSFIFCCDALIYVKRKWCFKVGLQFPCQTAPLWCPYYCGFLLIAVFIQLWIAIVFSVH